VIGIAVVLGLLGTIIGSFLNVVIYRVPVGRSIVSPPSACPGCGEPIKAHDNIPVVSWLLLRGKCRTCNAPISVRYPLVELGTGILFFLVGLLFVPPILSATAVPATIGAVLVLVAYLYLAAVSVVLALIDIDVRKLPNVIVLPSYLVGIVLFTAAAFLSADFDSLLRAGIAMVALALAYFLMVLVYPGGMGMGDVKLAGVLGLYLGWAGWGALFVGALAAFVLGGIFGIVLMISGRATRKTGIPFGPWMLAGASLGILFGSVVFSSYLSLFGLAVA
jgi:leader peptidase (prepilin peptidase)/N-methyltransferase